MGPLDDDEHGNGDGQGGDPPSDCDRQMCPVAAPVKGESKSGVPAQDQAGAGPPTSVAAAQSSGLSVENPFGALRRSQTGVCRGAAWRSSKPQASRRRRMPRP